MEILLPMGPKPLRYPRVLDILLKAGVPSLTLALVGWAIAQEVTDRDQDRQIHSIRERIDNSHATLERILEQVTILRITMGRLEERLPPK